MAKRSGGLRRGAVPYDRSAAKVRGADLVAGCVGDAQLPLTVVPELAAGVSQHGARQHDRLRPGLVHIRADETNEPHTSRLPSLFPLKGFPEDYSAHEAKIDADDGPDQIAGGSGQNICTKPAADHPRRCELPEEVLVEVPKPPVR